MRVINKRLENENCKVYFEQFNNYQEFLNVIEEREKTNTHSLTNTLKFRASDSEFAQVKNYEEARDLLINGWDAEIEYLKEQVNEASKDLDERKVLKQINDVVGFMPIVPNAILGLPNSMINMKKDNRKIRIIKFLIDTTVSANVSSREAMKYYSQVLARIALLERKGYRCRIEVMNMFSRECVSSGKVKAGCSVLIKSENQPFDLKRMAYPIAHVSMLRVFGFGWENTLPIDYEKYHCSALGTPMYHWGKEKRNNVLNAIRDMNEKIVYVNYRKDLETIFEKEVI